MLCFPQVLFAGGVVPVDDMALTGRVLSRGLANRYAFEGIRVDLRSAVPPCGGDLTGTAGSVGGSWLALLALTAIALLAAVWVVQRRCTSGRR